MPSKKKYQMNNQLFSTCVSFFLFIWCSLLFYATEQGIIQDILLVLLFRGTPSRNSLTSCCCIWWPNESRAESFASESNWKLHGVFLPRLVPMNRDNRCRWSVIVCLAGGVARNSGFKKNNEWERNRLMNDKFIDKWPNGGETKRFFIYRSNAQNENRLNLKRSWICLKILHVQYHKLKWNVTPPL